MIKIILLIGGLFIYILFILFIGHLLNKINNGYLLFCCGKSLEEENIYTITEDGIEVFICPRCKKLHTR